MDTPTSILSPPPPPPTPPEDREGAAPGPRTPMMRAFAVLAVLFAVLAVAWTCFTAVDLLARRTYHTTDSYPVVGALDLQTGDANVTIVPDATDRIVVDRTVRRGLVARRRPRHGTGRHPGDRRRLPSHLQLDLLHVDHHPHAGASSPSRGAWPTATSTTAGPLAR